MEKNGCPVSGRFSLAAGFERYRLRQPTRNFFNAHPWLCCFSAMMLVIAIIFFFVQQ